MMPVSTPKVLVRPQGQRQYEWVDLWESYVSAACLPDKCLCSAARLQEICLPAAIQVLCLRIGRDVSLGSAAAGISCAVSL
jgi:hypothetical protein